MDATNAQKTPLGTSLNQFATNRVTDAIQQLGKALPCSVVSVKGSIVTVKFEVQSEYTLPNITCPHFGPEYIRYPTQPGDKGVVFSADAYLGAVTGLGDGTANLKPRGNLSALVFFPIANAKWSSVDPNAVTIYGPNGVVTRDTQSNMTVTLSPTGLVAQFKNGTIFRIDSEGITAVMGGGLPFRIIGNLYVTGDIFGGYGTGDQIGLRTHIHSQGPDSHGDGEVNTNPPIPGT